MKYRHSVPQSQPFLPSLFSADIQYQSEWGYYRWLLERSLNQAHFCIFNSKCQLSPVEDLATSRQIPCCREWFPIFSLLHPNANSKDSHQCTTYFKYGEFCFKKREGISILEYQLFVKDTQFSFTYVSSQRDGYK